MMYLIGQFGNNLYMGTVRVFTTQHEMLSYLEEEREDWKQEAKHRSEYWQEALKTLHTFIPRANYRFYEFDSYDTPFTGQRDDRAWGMKSIPWRRVAKWAAEWEACREVTA